MSRTAIVSMSCLFPGAADPEEYWSLLMQGRDVRREHDGLPAPGVAEQDHRILTRRGGFVEDPQLRLDGLRLPAGDLAEMDRAFTWPVHVAREALDRVGRVDPERCGVVLGNYSFPTRTTREAVDARWYAAVGEGLRRAGLDPDLLPDELASDGPAPDAGLELRPGGLPARVVAAALGLGGPALCLDAACASSLYAVDVAIRRLAAGEVDTMIAGGVCVPDEELIHLCFSDLQAYSPDGRSQPFDATSRGILTGQGAAVVVLKRLDDALRDGDDVLGVIEGVGLSNDGRGRHLLAPAVAGQLRAYEAAYAAAGVPPESVGYVECHATGTPLGDRTELQGLAEFWVDRHGSRPAYGTVKPNIAHLLTVAGMSSLIKVVLSLRHGVIPPTIGVEEELVDPRVQGGLVREPRPWPAGVRRAGISAFGFGGTNAHLVVSDDTGPAPRGAEARADVPAASRLAIDGLGLASAADDSVRALRAGQRSGEPVLAPVSRTRLRGLASPPTPGVPGDRAIDELATDPLAMRIPPHDLIDFNTQQLVLMNAARAALTDAGLEPDTGEPRRVAVVIAAEMELDAHGHGARFRLGERLAESLGRLGVEQGEIDRVVAAATGGIHDGLGANEVLSYIGNLMASRISARWNLVGPSFTVAGDSTAAVDALTVAGDLLRDGSVDGVLVGAVDLATTVAAMTGAFAPPEGAADAASCLYLTDAEAQRTGERRTYAVIEASTSVTAAGLDTPAGLVAPAAAAVLDRVGWAPEEVGLLDVPADAAPFEALFSAPGRSTAVTSTRALLGDSLLASPLTALAAAALAMYDAQLPATPTLLVDRSPAGLPQGLRLCTEPEPWLRASEPLGRRAVVTATGLAGTAVAVALSGADLRGADPGQAAWGGIDAPRLLPVVAGDVDQVATRCAELARDLRGAPGSLALRAREERERWRSRQPGERCLVVVGRDDEEVLTELERAAAGLRERVASGKDWTTPAGSFLPARPVDGGKVAFVFPGAFNSYVGLGRDLFDAFPALVPAFEEATSRPAAVLRTERLYPRADAPLERRDLMRLDGELLEDIPFMLASGTSVSLLHAMLLERLLGVRADGAFGYSLGESSMMFAMGGWDPAARDDQRISATPLFTDGLTGSMDVVRAQWGVPADDPAPLWATSVVLADAEAARAEVARHERAFLTHVNTPREVVVAGAPDAVAAVVENLGARAARAPANHVMHCPVVDPVREQLADLNRYPTRPIDTELLSAFDYDRVPDLGPDAVADRIAETLRTTIDFPRLVESAYRRGYRYFVEVGPGGTCTRWISEILGDSAHVAVAMDRRGAPAARTVAGVAARLLAHGLDVDVDQLLTRMSPAAAPGQVTVVCGGEPVADAVRAQAGDLSGIRPAAPAPSPAPPTPVLQEGRPVTTDRSHPGSSEPLRRTPTATPLPLHAPAPVPVAAGGAEQPAAPVFDEAQIELLVVQLRDELSRSEEFLARVSGEPVAAPPADPGNPPASAPVARVREEGVIFDAADLTEFAVGRIAEVFGPEYAAIDGYRRRVRLPADPYHFVSRVTALEGKLGERGTATITTEYDVPEDAWYATDGQVPPAVTIEAGQCDLLLASYLGIDLDNQGERVYRLLDSSLTFHGDLPRVGQTLRYDITIDRWVETPGPTLFFFRYLCYADGELVVELTDGCAGFFTDEELEASSGVLRPRRLDDAAHQQRFDPLARTTRTSLAEEDLRLLSAGRVAEVFGPEHEQGEGVNPSIRLAPGELLMVDAVDELTTTGGRFGLGGVVARKRLRPDGWYFTSHFVDDPVLPGSLVAEGAVQLLQTYAMAQGLHLVFPDARFQPVTGVTTVVNVRGQVLPEHPEIRYEVDIKRVGLLPRPSVVADVTVYVGEKPSVRIVDLAIGIAEKPGTPYAPAAGGTVPHFLGRRNRDGEAALLNEFHMAHAAKGDLAVAMGPEFGVYEGRRAPYIPNGDFLFVDRVMVCEGTRGQLTPGAVMETEYDVPADAWYVTDNGSPVVPNCLLMESSLQSAILLGYYLGATLPFPEESFRIRNLDGTATITRRVDLRGKTIRQRSVLLASIPMPGSVLQKFSYELSTDGEVFYRGESMFGYFNDAALSQQLGLDNGSFVPPWGEGDHGLPVLSRTAADYAGRAPALPRGQLELAGAVDVVPGGGSEGLGYVAGRRDIDTDDWYFRCHFHTDPVMPGSLGVEAMVTALEMLAVETGLTAGIADPEFAPAVDVPFTWRYRGQIPHEDLQMSYELHVTEVRREPDRVVVVARGSLWRPGLRIYEVDGLAVEIRTSGREGA